MLALDLLGPVLLRRDGAVLPVTVKKTQALLVLLARAGSLPRSRIAALLWPDLDDSSGRRNLRRELARLREGGAADAVRIDGDLVGPAAAMTVDVRIFEAAIAEGRPDDALVLWRGPAADGLQLDNTSAFGDWLAQQRDTLQGLRQRALAASAAALETRGDHEAALRRIEQLLADDPLQEQHHRDAMRLHAACGRREAALAQYSRCRTLLQQELGLAPMAETEALLATLRGAESPPAVRPAEPNRLLPDSMPFVGRQTEVALLEAAWSAGRAVLIEAEGGVGKSRLALDFVAAHGPYAVTRCRPGDGEVPYASFARALRSLAGPAPALDGVARWVVDELARLLPELGPAPPPIRSGDEMNRFFEACAQGWLAWAGDSFDAVVLDDWHLADSASHALLAFVAQRRREQGGGGAREWLLLRPELDVDVLRRLADGLQVTPLRLLPLDEAAVFDLVRRLSGAAKPQRFAARLRQATAGNPFFLAETLRHLAEQQWLSAGADGVWRTPFDEATQDYRELPVPASVHDAVLGRVQRLGAAGVRVLEAAALAGEPFVPALLAPACALSELATVLAIESAVAAQLLREHDAGGFAFAHDHVQQALEASLTPERRRLVHRRLALAAEATQAGAATTALHFEAAGDPARAVALRLTAGDEARRLFANRQALLQWRTALADGPTPGQALQLQVRCAQVLADIGDGPAALACVAAVDVLVSAADLPVDERWLAQLAVAELEVDLLWAAQALQRSDTVLAAAGDAAVRAKALRVRGHALAKLGRIDDARQALRAALDSGVSGPLERAALLDTLGLIEYQRGQAHKALALAREATALWTAHGDRRGSVTGHQHTGIMLTIVGEVDAALVELRLARALASQMHLVEQEREAIVNLAKIAADRGDVQQLLDLADEGWRLSPSFARPRTRQILLQARFHGHSVLGQLGAALAIGEQVLAEAETDREPFALQYAVLAVLDLLVFLGDIDRGRALLARLAGGGAGEMAFLGVKVAFNHAFLEIRAGNTARARRLLADVAAQATLEQPQDRATLALRQAELQLADGDADAALASLEPWRDAVPNVELLALIWAVRLTAQQRLGAVVAADWQQARAALDGGRMPAMEALDLQAALCETAPTPELAQLLAAELRQATGRLAASLVDWPVHQARFLARRGLT
jgi:DNA-binding SARP family transcriptional activator